MLSNSIQSNTINTTANTISNSNIQSQTITSHYSTDTRTMTSTSGVMMNNNNNTTQEQSTIINPSINNGGLDIDIDLKGIPSYILDLQYSQPTLNIMTCGDVSHGKSTLLWSITGEKTGKHAQEKKGNMTIRLGYTSAKIWKCLNCPKPQCYFTTHSDINIKKVICKYCNTKPTKTYQNYLNTDSKIILLRHLSFVDVPGHAQLMQTMVSATSVSDAAILVIDASKKCPGGQTEQHMDAINLLGLMKYGNLIIAQNKIDLINESKACVSYQQIRKYLNTFGNEYLTYNTPIIPISAQSKLNIDALCYTIVNYLPKFSKRLLHVNNMPKMSIQNNMSDQSLKSSDLYMNIIRSFDVNRAKDISCISDISNIRGGVIGGAILNGHVSIGQCIEIRPGYIKKKPLQKFDNILKNKLQPKWEVKPIRTIIKSLKYGKHNACNGRGYPGGNIGIQTNIDPSLTKSDQMCGHIIIDSNNNSPPPIFDKFIMSYSFLCNYKPKPWGKFESIRVNIGSFKMEAEIIKRDLNEYNGIMCVLKWPICANIGDTVGICRKGKKKEWAFIGGGIIRKTCNIFIQSDYNKLNGTKSMKCQPQILINKLNENESKNENANDNNNMSVGIGRKSLIVNESKLMVHIRYQQRNTRKGVTTIVGLPQKCNLDKLKTKMKKKYGAGATLVPLKDDDGNVIGKVIQIQGDLRRKIAEDIVKLGIVGKNQITIHGA